MYGIVGHATGRFLRSGNGWEGIVCVDGSFDHLQVSRQIWDPAHYGESAARILDDLRGLDGSVNRCDVFFWWCDPAITDLLIADHLAAATEAIASRFAVDDLSDRWRTNLSWPRAWHPPSVNRYGEQVLILTCTREARSVGRLWFVGSTAPYEAGGRPSLSGLLETDDQTGWRGALADYATKLGPIRQGLLVSMEADRQNSAPQVDPPPRPESLLRYAVLASRLHAALADFDAARLNTERVGRRLAAGLTDLCPGGEWPFLSADTVQIAEARATMSANAERARANQQVAEAIRRHDDVRLHARSSQSVALATTLLTVAFGAIGSAQVPASPTDKYGLALLSGGGLLSLGILVSEGGSGYRRGHVAIASIGGGGALAGVGILTSAAHPALLAAVGAVVVAVVAVAVYRLARSSALAPLRHFFSRPLS